MNAPLPPEATIEAPVALPIRNVEDFVVPGQRPFAAIGFALGAPCLAVAVLGSTAGWMDALVVLFAALGIAAIIAGLNFAARQEANRERLARATYGQLPVTTLARATVAPDLSEKTRVLIANLLNARGENLGQALDAGDEAWQALKLAGPPSACGKGCCGPTAQPRG